MIYVNGYALTSARGANVKECTKAIKASQSSFSQLSSGTPYYKIDDTLHLPYYQQIEQIIIEALDAANIDTSQRNDVAFFLGTSSSKLPLNETIAREKSLLLYDLNMDEITEIIAKRLGFCSFRTIISTACTSSANALMQAKEMLETGLISKAVVVGVELYNLLSLKGFESFMLLTQDSMKPFDKNRSGIVLGEGLSAVVLSKTKSPFVFAGSANSVDTASITAPTAKHLSTVMQKAMKSANITTKEIQAVKTHSTATQQNDEAEAKALHSIFHDNIPLIVPLKPYIGHTMGACGTNELVLFLESLRQGFIPKSVPFETIDSACNIVPSQEMKNAQQGYYLFNYFGFGGNNSSLVFYYEGVR